MPRPTQKQKHRPALERMEPRLVPATITVAPTSVTEAGTATAAVFTATLDSATTTPVTLTYSTVDGTAKAGKDYVATRSSVTIPAGQTGATFTVPVRADNVSNEGTERFFVNLKASAGNTLASRRVVGRIVDGNAAPTASLADVTVPTVAGSTRSGVVVTLSNPSAKPVKVSYTTVDATATSTGSSRAYRASSGTITIPAGKTGARIPVTITRSSATDAVFDVAIRSLTNATYSGTSFGSRFAQVIIAGTADASTRPTVAVSSPTVAAGGLANFAVSLSRASSVPVTLRFTTADGTATVASGAYTAANDVLTIPAGQTTATIAIPTAAVAGASGSQTFNLTLSAIAGANPTLTSATATITNAGTGAGTTTPTLAVGDATFSTTNGPPTETFTVTLSAAATTPVTVDYATFDGTARAGTDYTATSGTLTFDPGVTTQTITVPLLPTMNAGSTAVNFGLLIANATNATVDDASGVATITPLGGPGTGTGTGTGGGGTTVGTGSDGTPTSTPGATVTGGTTTVGTTGTATITFTVNLSAATTTTVTIDYATSDISALAGTDYVGVSGTLTFAPGVTAQSVSVTVNGEATTDTTKTFDFNLGNASGAEITTGTAVGTISYATGTPKVAVQDASASVGTGGSANVVFTVTLTAASASTVTVDYATADGTAVAGTDYTSTSGTLTFDPGVTSLTIAVPVAGETATGSNKTFTLNLSGATNTSNASASATGTINAVSTTGSTDLADNLGNTSGGAESATGTTYVAAAFTTGSNAYTLDDVQLLLAEAATGAATVALYSDGGLEPGTVLATLTSPTTYSATAAATTFTAASGLTLAANTTYWVVLSAPSGTFDWSWTDDNTGTGVGFVNAWAESTDAAASWFTYNAYPVQMRVDATITS